MAMLASTTSVMNALLCVLHEFGGCKTPYNRRCFACQYKLSAIHLLVLALSCLNEHNNKGGTRDGRFRDQFQPAAGRQSPARDSCRQSSARGGFRPLLASHGSAAPRRPAWRRSECRDHHGHARRCRDLDVPPGRLDTILHKMGLEIAMQLATDQRLLRDFDAQARATGTLRRRARNSTTARTMGNLNRRLSVLSISPSLKKALKSEHRASRGRA